MADIHIKLAHKVKAFALGSVAEINRAIAVIRLVRVTLTMTADPGRRQPICVKGHTPLGELGVKDPFFRSTKNTTMTANVEIVHKWGLCMLQVGFPLQAQLFLGRSECQCMSRCKRDPL